MYTLLSSLVVSLSVVQRKHGVTHSAGWPSQPPHMNLDSTRLRDSPFTHRLLVPCSPWDLQTTQSRHGFFFAAVAGMRTGQCLDLLNSRRSKLLLSARNLPGLTGGLISLSSTLRLTSCSSAFFRKLRCFLEIWLSAWMRRLQQLGDVARWAADVTCCIAQHGHRPGLTFFTYL